MHKLLMSEATKPINTLSPKLTKPAAGVMATKPTTAPMQAPTADIFLSRYRSKKIHVIMAVAEARLVLANAKTASDPAEKAEPAL